MAKIVFDIDQYLLEHDKKVKFVLSVFCILSILYIVPIYTLFILGETTESEEVKININIIFEDFYEF